MLFPLFIKLLQFRHVSIDGGYYISWQLKRLRRESLQNPSVALCKDFHVSANQAFFLKKRDVR